MKFISRKGDIAINLWLAFFAALAVAYSLLNPPLRSAAAHLQPVILALVLMASFCGWGAPWVALIKADRRRGDAVLLSAAIGIGATGLFVFILGMLGSTAPVFHSLWVLAGLLSFGYFLWRRWLPPGCRCDMQNPLTLLSVAIAIPFLLLVIPPLVAPVTSMDSLYYQLLVPKIYLRLGEIAPIPFLVESNYPCLAQYVYLLAMNLASDVACNALHFALGLLSLLAMGRLVARASPGSNRWLGPVLFCSMPAFILSASWAWNDAFFLFFILLCLGSLLDYHLADDKQDKVRSLILAGILAGLASWVKYTFFMVFACLLLLILFGLVRWKWKGRHLAWFFVPLLPLSLLTFVKNWLFTGNPVFPFLHRFFPSPHWNDAAAAYFVQALRRFEFPHWDLSTFFLFPFQLTLKPPLIDIHIGIVPLALLPLLFFRSRNKGISFLKAFCLCYLLSWLFFQTITRSLFPLLAVVFCVGAIELEQRIWKNQAFRRPLVLFLCLSSLASLVVTMTTHYHLTRPVSYFLGLESRERYLLREAQSQPVYDWLNRTPRVGKVLLVGLHAPYHLQRDALFSSIADPPIAQWLSRGVADPGQLAAKLAGLGVTHVVIHPRQYDLENRGGLYSWSPRQKRVFEGFIAGFCRPEALSAEEKILRLVPPKN